MAIVQEKATDVTHIEDEDEEEPGEEIESAPPQKVGEEREVGRSGIKKKLIGSGESWETPEFGDEVTVHYVGTLVDGTVFDSTRDRAEPLIIKLGQGEVASGLDDGIVTMKKGERAVFVLPPELGYGAEGHDGVPPNSIVQFEVELVSWITVVDVCKDGGIIKKIVGKGEGNGTPGDLDEVLVYYQVALVDGTIVAKTPEEGVEFYVKDGRLCPALPKAIKTMKRGEKVQLTVQPNYAFGEEGRVADDGFPAVPPNSVLNIELNLISYKPVIDVFGDSKVFKKIVKSGEGVTVPNESASVTISYTARLEDGTVFEKRGIDGIEPLQFITDEEQVIAGLDKAVATMGKGERVILTISPDYGFGSEEVNRDLSTVPPCSKLVYEVEMLDFIKEKNFWELDNPERIEFAQKKKEEGNVLFKSGKYERAEKKYEKAAFYINEDVSSGPLKRDLSFGDDEKKLVKELRVSCWLNSAACSLKLENFREAIRLCSKVLDVESYNVKALYRRAQAYMGTSDLISADVDIKRALESDPQNREVKQIQKELKQLQAESNKRDTKLFRTMFARMRKDSSVASKKPKLDEGENVKKEGEVVAMDMETNGDSLAPSENQNGC